MIIRLVLENIMSRHCNARSPVDFGQFLTILGSFEKKFIFMSCHFSHFDYSPIQGTFFLGPVFNSFVHFLQYFHFYASYDSDFFTEVLPWLWGMFFIPRSCFWNDFPPFCGHLKQTFSTKSLKKCSRDNFLVCPKVTFSDFLSKTFASNDRRIVGNHFKNMIWVWKTFLRVRAIRQ